MALTPPNKIVIDFLDGVTSRVDAVSYARGFISSHFDVPEQSGFYVMPYKGGYAFEVHEGGSRRAFLPSILRMIEESPNATVSIRSGSRVLQVSKGARDSFNAVLLPEELSSYLENVIEPDGSSSPLVAYQIDNIVWLFWGLITLGFGVLVLLLSLGIYFLSPKPPKPVESITTPIEALPIAQWQQMLKKLDGTNFISQMKYEKDQWSFVVLPNPDNVSTENLHLEVPTQKNSVAEEALTPMAVPSSPVVIPPAPGSSR